MSRSSSTLYRPTTKYKRRRHPTPMTKQQVKQGISDGTIPSAISDTGATSTAGALHDPFHSTTKPSTKTLLSGSKFADAGYTAVYNKDEVNFYDSNKIHINATSILQGYRCPHTGLWRVPLRQITCNINNDTLILDSPCGTKSLNTKYVVPSTEEICALLASSSTREQHSILNVYELPSIQQTIRYLHAAAGFPTKTTWMAAIRHGNYDTWPLVTVANVHKHFPQSEETQQGHMRSQRQGVRSTKTTRHAPPTIPSHTAPLSLTMTYLSRPTTPGHSLLRSNRPSTLGPKTYKTSSASNNFSVRCKATAGTSNCKRTCCYPRPTSKGANTNANPHGLARPSTSHVVSDEEDSDDEAVPPPRVPTRRPVPSPPCQQPATTPPALNTRSRTRSITHETMLHFLATHHIGLTAARATQQRYPPDMLHAVLNDETGELMEYRHLIANPKYRDTWQNAYGKELGRLAQGLPGIVKGTDTIAFIQRSHVPQDQWKDVTYGRIVANFCPEKEDPYRIRLTVGGNCINYP
eukprot:CCRYP_016768-RA/>CCRYP_016768-RA protein AED:0.31 eAED:0.20 QI:0/0/0/0.66/1/0.66/3/0/521